jgi:large conductance mechanosensitive channel
MRALWEDFKKFVMRGNVLDLAVAVILGVAFNAVVQSLVDDVITPIVGAVFGEPNFNGMTADVGDGVLAYGAFVTEVVNFLIVAASLFVIVKAFERLQRLRGRPADAETPAPSDEAVLLTEIRDLLRARS